MKKIREKLNGLYHQLRHFVLHDYLRKLCALFFTIIVFVLFYRDAEGSKIANIKEKDVNNVKVNFKLEDGLLFRTQKAPEIPVTLKVKAPDNIPLTSADFKIAKTITKDQFPDNAKHEIKLENSDITCDIENVKIMKITPNSISLELDRCVEKTDVPIKLNYEEHELLDGYKVDSVNIAGEQNTVTITGPAQLVEGINEILTEKIPLNNVTQDFSYVVKLKCPDKNGLRLSFDKIPVKVTIKGPEDREFHDVPVQILADGNSRFRNFTSEADPAVVTVKVRGDHDLNRILEKKSIHPYVDISKLDKPGIYEMTLKCWCDRNEIQILEIKPNIVSLKLMFDVKLMRGK